MALLLASMGCGAGQREARLPLRAPSVSRTFGAGGETLRYLVLGDSTAVAEGGDYEQGIAVETAGHLARGGRRVELTNVAVSGARVHDVLTEQLPRADLAHADLVLVDAGANDVIHITRSGAVARDLERIVKTLLRANCKMKIVITGSPDMSVPPRIPRLLRGLAGVRFRALNRIAKEVVKRHALTFAPIAERTGPIFARDRTLFSADRFHPNNRGYGVWIPVLNEALDQALADQPGHCPP
ncbi:MAG: SGNH/GDSL hydrolase family protein [Thermoanaerobaculia bacterium]